MTPERWRRLKGLFGEALEVEPAERGAWAETACGGDEPLCAELAALLASHQGAGAFLETPILESAVPGAAAEPERPIARIGPYRVLRELGQGGMGTVWLGERDDPEFRRQVAIKVIRRGMDHEAVVARFRKERQILADLSHPNIATLLDGGTTDEGLPYFVMEHIEGEPIDRFCDARRLPVSGRLELMLPVCAAVAYANGRQVVHRDLKPGNVLVTAEGVPKLLDFGLARLLDPRGASDQTTADFRFFTPAFASPEQIAGGTITAASDVWSLGAVLYVLVTGRRPRQAAEGMAGTPAGGAPTRPSEVVVRQAAGADGPKGDPGPDALAAPREGTPDLLRRRLAGDLDAILLRALEAAPERRYRTAGELGDDLRRHLAGERVAARRRPGAKTAGRAVAAGLLASALTAGLAVLGLRSWRAGPGTEPPVVHPAGSASLEAVQHYYRGEQLQDDLRYQAALEAYRRAVALDPAFAQAHYQIAHVGKLHGLDPAVRREAMVAALRNLDRAPPRERLLIQAWQASEAGDAGAGATLYRQAADAYPRDKQVLYLAGDFHYHGGRYAEALPYFERAVAVDPAWEPALLHLTDSLYYLGRSGDLLEHARAWAARTPGGQAFRALAWAEAAAGQADAAVATARRAFDVEASIWNRVTLAVMLLHVERHAEAEALARAGLESASGALHRAAASRALALALAYQGRLREGARVVEALPESVDGRGGLAAWERMFLLLGGGDATAVGREAARLARLPDPGDPAALALAMAGDGEGAARAAARLPPGVLRTQVEAALARLRGDRAGALAALRELRGRRLLDGASVTLWLLARVLLEDGQDEEAAGVLEELRATPGDSATPGGLVRSWAFAQSLHLEAAARERLGDRARARQLLERFLAARRGADPGLPFAAEAQAMRRRLEAARVEGGSRRSGPAGSR